MLFSYLRMAPPQFFLRWILRSTHAHMLYKLYNMQLKVICIRAIMGATIADCSREQHPMKKWGLWLATRVSVFRLLVEKFLQIKFEYIKYCSIEIPLAPSTANCIIMYTGNDYIELSWSSIITWNAASTSSGIIPSTLPMSDSPPAVMPIVNNKYDEYNTTSIICKLLRLGVFGDKFNSKRIKLLHKHMVRY